MVDQLSYNNGNHGLSKRMSVKESLLILFFDDSCFSRRTRMRYFLGEMNMENTETGNRDGELGRDKTRKKITTALKGNG